MEGPEPISTGGGLRGGKRGHRGVFLFPPPGFVRISFRKVRFSKSVGEVRNVSFGTMVKEGLAPRKSYFFGV